MDYNLLLLIGLLQGVLEWLPVSSEGIVFIVSNIIGVKPSLSFVVSIIFHLPTGLAALIYFKDDYYSVLRNLFTESRDPLFDLLLYSTIGTVFTGLPLYFLFRFFLEELEATISYFSTLVILFVGLVMIALGFLSRSAIFKSGGKAIVSNNLGEFFLIGLIQGFAVIPGVSRSAITISSFLFLGYSKEEAVRGSFFILPVVSVGIFLVSLVFEETSALLLFNLYGLISITISFLVSLAVIRMMLSLARNLEFWKFLLLIGLLITVASLVSLYVNTIMS